MSCILFYHTFNQRSRDAESLMIAFSRQGHRVISLSLSEGSEIHDFLKPYGITTLSHITQSKIPWLRHWRNLRHLMKFSRENGVNIIYSHLPYANFIAALAQLFMSIRIYTCRHHADQYRLLKLDRDFSYRITYWLARRIIVVSETAKRFMVDHEGIPASRIIHINLAYDFSLYPVIRRDVVEKIRKETSGVLLITVGRLNALKRPDLSINVLKSLIRKGCDATLILLGAGEREDSLRKLTDELGLAGKVLFPGYVSNVTEYIAAATFLLHPSISEASCVVVKEAGLAKVPAIVCRGTGDFDSYLVHGENGYLCDQAGFVEEASEIIFKNHNRWDVIDKMGDALQRSILDHFGIEHVIDQYKTLNQI